MELQVTSIMGGFKDHWRPFFIITITYNHLLSTFMLVSSFYRVAVGDNIPARHL